MILLIIKNEIYRNKRIAYLLAILTTIFFGLASRKYSNFLLPVVSHNAGDALWSMMVYYGFHFLWIQKSLSTVIFFSLLFSFGIEFSQLYQAEWINQTRGTALGALIFGHRFLPVDLTRYLIGVLLASFFDQQTIIL
ncbi:DUF2809 domain-containing protein [Planococcus chinensis]|uniref:ribosomal maturation YjgA family protein n=1 Tax=Planococcus chinensis TaxID=272917 RepID=UPI001CC35BDC|nr:DUF2809 domain-containing protein [Planococcus chinensis]